MKKLFTKAMATVVTMTMIAALALGVNFARTADADASDVTVTSWTFKQGGWYSKDGGDGEGNSGYLNKISFDNGYSITGWNRGAGDDAVNQAQTYNGTPGSVILDIQQTGWDRDWNVSPRRINPWSIMGIANATMEPGHIYEITFDIAASKTKNCYMAFNTVVDGQSMAIHGGAGLNEGSDDNIIVLNKTAKSMKYNVTNFVSGQVLDLTFMLGAFGADVDGNLYDYDGEEILPSRCGEDTSWSGTVTISNVKIVDKGVDPRFTPTESTPAKPTVAPTTQPITEQPTGEPETTKPAPTPTKKLGKVTGVKVKNPKKKTIKVSWKKVKNAKKYQIKVGSKTYTSTKTSKTIKNKKFKKKKKVKVKVRATASGYKTGAWSKTVTKKLKK